MELESNLSDDVSVTIVTPHQTNVESESSELFPALTVTDVLVVTMASIERYYAVYCNDPRLTYIWGITINTFMKVESDYLQKNNISSNPRD